MEAHPSHTFTLVREDWEMIKRALIVYSASLEPDKSEAALRERGFAIALSNLIGYEL